jgi:pyruvate/2-oxoglutarate/acetoin dehydrogenase E1 component
VTVVGWGTQLYVLEKAIAQVENAASVSCELIDLRSILPWDRETVLQVNYSNYSSFNCSLSLWKRQGGL